MKDYYDIFVELSCRQCSKDDYSVKNKVNEHNEASEKLLKLQNEMRNNVSEDILKKLLAHSDERVRINSASFCLQFNIMQADAVKILSDIAADSEDPTFRLSAMMILRSYKA